MFKAEDTCSKLCDDYSLKYCSSRYLLVQSQQWRHQNNVRNLVKVKNKETRMTSVTSSDVIIVNFDQILKIILMSPLLTFSKYMSPGMLNMYENEDIKTLSIDMFLMTPRLTLNTYGGFT